MTSTPLSSSFRDPSGFVFERDGVLYRQINRVYEQDYQHVQQSGLYKRLTSVGLLIPHREAECDLVDHSNALAIIRPERVSFISYPYEWCFSQLRDAALCTLEIQRLAIEHGMTLKDASAYNVQFHEGRPIWIDTLSFTRYTEGEPWVAYRQFCQHFLAPLAVMAHCDVRLGRLLQDFIDGMPLDLIVGLLPWRTRLRLPLLLHLHWHARAQRKAAVRRVSVQTSNGRNFSRRAMLGLIDNLKSGIQGLSLKPIDSVWAGYYEETNYSSESMERKCLVVDGFLRQLAPEVVWDLGANTGQFSRIAAQHSELTVAFDFDALAVERNYQQSVQQRIPRVLPLVQDLFNPSPGLGWRHQERMSLVERGPADAVLALALVHHLAIGNNVPMSQVAEFLATLGRHLIVEFVPRDDSQVLRMLGGREGQFPHYTQREFESQFSKYYRIDATTPLDGTKRTLYLMTRSNLQ